MFEFNLDVGEFDATFTVEDYTPGERGNRDCPPSGAEVMLGDSVTLTDGDGNTQVVSLDRAVHLYQSAKGLTRNEAIARLEDEALEDFEYHLASLADDY